MKNGKEKSKGRHGVVPNKEDKERKFRRLLMSLMGLLFLCAAALLVFALLNKDKVKMINHSRDIAASSQATAGGNSYEAKYLNGNDNQSGGNNKNSNDSVNGMIINGPGNDGKSATQTVGDGKSASNNMDSTHGNSSTDNTGGGNQGPDKGTEITPPSVPNAKSYTCSIMSKTKMYDFQLFATMPEAIAWGKTNAPKYPQADYLITPRF
ncbi:MAG: hypothetical protein FWF42_02755 [Streptococcaceae bacterium]|nr:hypothetical protein [Streptococcaceae bacterium]MCL2858589.1 hypothetical protein [Streptococcaceae bacterium]